MVFASQIVFDVVERRLRHLRPLPPDATVDPGFLGPSFSNEVACGVADGNLHPASLERLGCGPRVGEARASPGHRPPSDTTPLPDQVRVLGSEAEAADSSSRRPPCVQAQIAVPLDAKDTATSQFSLDDLSQLSPCFPPSVSAAAAARNEASPQRAGDGPLQSPSCSGARLATATRVTERSSTRPAPDEPARLSFPIPREAIAVADATPAASQPFRRPRRCDPIQDSMNQGAARCDAEASAPKRRRLGCRILPAA